MGKKSQKETHNKFGFSSGLNNNTNKISFEKFKYRRNVK